MAYAEKLRDPRWLEYRERIIRRDGGRCCDCQTDKELQVHHLAYWFGADPWDYEAEALRTLCKACHERAEAERYGFLVDWGRLPQWQRFGVARDVKAMLPKSPKVERKPEQPPEPNPFEGLTPEESSALLMEIIAAKRKEQGIVVPECHLIPVLEVANNVG